MLKKSILFITIIFTTLVFGQKIPKGIFVEAINKVDSTKIECFISFRISYDQFVFVKDNSQYIAGFSFSAEAMDSLDKTLKREIVEKKVLADNYEQTLRNDLYVDGLLKLILPIGKCKVLPIFVDKNSSVEYRLNEIKMDIPKSIDDIVNCLVVKNEQKAGKGSVYVLANSNGAIPFSQDSYDLLISVGDTSITRLTLEFSKDDSTYQKIVLSNSFLSSYDVVEDNNYIQLLFDKNKKSFRNFIASFINKNLFEGSYNLRIISDKQKTKTIPIEVEWINKPKCLGNVVMAARLVKYIADVNEIRKFKTISDNILYKSIFDFWRKYDPTPNTIFNELMQEYYQRADYCIKNFSSIETINGAETDRGRIYIQNGKPDDVKRIYSGAGNVDEIWIYNSPYKKFVFNDKTGLGNFILEN